MADSKGLEDLDQNLIESNYDEVTDSFDAMALRAELLRGMISSPSQSEVLLTIWRRCLCLRYATPQRHFWRSTNRFAGFERPSAIQQRAIVSPSLPSVCQRSNMALDACY